MDETRHGEGVDKGSADESRSLVDRVRETIGDGAEADPDAPFNRGALTAWLGEDHPPPAATEAVPRLPEATPRRASDEEVAPRAHFNRRLILVAALAVVLAAGMVATTGLAVVNARRAADWEDRAEQVQVRTKIINDLLVERSHDLNARTRELNAAAARLRTTRQALRRSEADVRALVRRQTELANEKAQAEDRR